MVEGAFDEFCGGFGEFDADHEAAAADVGEFSLEARLIAQAGDGLLAELIGMGDEVFAFDHIEDGAGNGHADGIAAEGAAVLAGNEELGDCGLGEHNADGEAAADGFAQGEDVGFDGFAVGGGEVLVAEPAAGAAAAGPYFVEDEGDALLIAEGADLGGVFGGVEVDAAFSLDRLDDDACGFVIDGLFEGFDVAGFDLKEAGDGGFEALFYGRISRGRDHRQRAAVKTFLKRDDFPTFGRRFVAAQTGEFACRFVGFEAAVAEKRLPLEGVAIELFRQRDLRLGMIRVSDVPELLRLRRRRGDESRMAVAEDGAAEAGEEVDVFAAVCVPKAGAFAFRHDDRLALVVSDENFVGAVENELGV